MATVTATGSTTATVTATGSITSIFTGPHYAYRPPVVVQPYPVVVPPPYPVYAPPPPVYYPQPGNDVTIVWRVGF